MAKKKNFYAVKVGSIPGIYTTWEECLKYTSGYPNAQYQGFFTEEEAIAYMTSSEINDSSTMAVKQDALQFPTEPEHAIAYIDGSYDDKLKRYGYGVVFVSTEAGKHPESGYGDDNDKLLYRNVTGEILGALTAMRLAVQGNYRKLTLFYDYEGIEKWVSGEWKAKTPLTKEYVDKVSSYKKIINLEFIHVKSHSGVALNEEADELARSAIQKSSNIARGIATSGATWLTLTGVTEKDIADILDIIIAENTKCSFSRITQPGITQFSVIMPSEKLTIKHYANTGKTCIQGKQGYLYQLLVSYLGVIVDDPEKMTEVLNAFYDIDIPRELIEKAYQHYLPCVTGLPATIDTLIRQAIYNTIISGNMYDYGHLVTPALRAVEYHLREQLQQRGVIIQLTFDCFETTIPGGTRYQLKDEFRRKVNDSFLIQHINDCYNYIHKNRHTLTHSGLIVGQANDARLVRNRKDAVELIESALGIINAYYASLT